MLPNTLSVSCFRLRLPLDLHLLTSTSTSEMYTLKIYPSLWGSPWPCQHLRESRSTPFTNQSHDSFPWESAGTEHLVPRAMLAVEDTAETGRDHYLLPFPFGPEAGHQSRLPRGALPVSRERESIFILRDVRTPDEPAWTSFTLL